MRKWLTRVVRAAAMGLAWAAAWVPVGSVVGWLTVGELEPEHIGGPLYAGFICGAMFATLAGIADGRREFDQMSFFQAGSRGAVSGLLVGALWVVVAVLSDPPLWLFYGGVVGSLTLLSAVSAVASVWLARKAKERDYVTAGR